MTVRERATVHRNPQLTFRANTGVGRHGWLRLTPAYGVRLVRERVSHLPPGSVVTDPFSGTGTTPLAAAELGHRGQSVDVNPFLVWLGRAKTAAYPPDVRRRAVAAAGTAADDARDLVRAAAGAPLAAAELWQPALHRIERWWEPGVLLGLKALRHGIDAADVPAPARDLLDVALCRTLIGTSNAAFNHQSMSFRAAPDAAPAGRGRARAAGLATVDRFVAEAAGLAESAGHDLAGSAVIRLGDSRTGLDGLEPCDLLLTSPPYVNRMSYIRELRPYMYWLRYLDAPPDAGELDWRAIGGTWGTATSRLGTWSPQTTTPVDDALGEVCARIAADGGRNGPLLATYVHKYFHDMWQHFQAAAAHVKPGGTARYVIGNSTFYGHVVPAERWYAAMLSSAGFERVGVETLRKRNSNKALFEYEVSATRP